MWKIVFYTDHRGKCPPLEFINDLPALDQAKIRNGLRLLREFGIRLFYFAILDQQFVILHGYRKQSNKAPASEIAIALRRLNELLEED